MKIIKTIKEKIGNCKENKFDIKKKALSLISFFTFITYPTAVFAAGTAAINSFFSSAIDNLGTIVIAIGAGLAVWGLINLLEGYGGDNPQSKSQGIKQLVSGIGIGLVGAVLIPLMNNLF